MEEDLAGEGKRLEFSLFLEMPIRRTVINPHFKTFPVIAYQM